jgi:hypothetical protein
MPLKYRGKTHKNKNKLKHEKKKFINLKPNQYNLELSVNLKQIVLPGEKFEFSFLTHEINVLTN